MKLKVDIKRLGKHCPFADEQIVFELNEGECLWLQGDSGAGKSSIALHLVGLRPLQDAAVEVAWELPSNEEGSFGMLFQQGVLIDTLNVEENLGLALRAVGLPADHQEIVRSLEEVGLQASDATKMPGQLSGGMLRRASLAQILTQQRKVIVLDEPFVGLDQKNAQGIVALIQTLLDRGLSFILISHDTQYSEPIVTEGRAVTLHAETQKDSTRSKRLIPHWRFGMRTSLRLFDYLVISTPLIIFAFLAAGVAISMMFSELLQATSVGALKEQILNTKPSLVQKLFGVEIFNHFVSNEFDKIASEHLPAIRRKIYALGISRGFVTELGPLLTALLLAGRIGGAYAGEVSMMQATNQNQLLKTLGVSPRRWTLAPSAIAALVSAPLLTGFGIVTAIFMAQMVGLSDSYGLFDTDQQFWNVLREKVFAYPSLWAFPPFVAFYHSIVFMTLIIIVAEVAGRLRPTIQPRGVPQSITWAVVIASLLIIIADWGLSQLYLRVAPPISPFG